ncbi:hypothetical protein GGX14DRAFT_669276 [Mycena pura]|uniref:RING-type domain-containing protein n=1 Tax=Mycena pura TaxID=153505 RepID=A0AAD6VS57_9AGAR|nr:hypothetical protein GGX14DRAFT_669276 [Mycena pura]
MNAAVRGVGLEQSHLLDSSIGRAEAVELVPAIRCHLMLQTTHLRYLPVLRVVLFAMHLRVRRRTRPQFSLGFWMGMHLDLTRLDWAVGRRRGRRADAYRARWIEVGLRALPPVRAHPTASIAVAPSTRAQLHQHKPTPALMPLDCSICHRPIAAPVSLPCGHVFCLACVRHTVDAIKACSVQHFCPACRAPYSVVTIDPALVPPYLRPHVLPPIRPLFLGDAPPAGPPAPTPSFSTTHRRSQRRAAPQPHARSRSASPAATAAVEPTASTSQQIQVLPPTPTIADLGRAAAEAAALRLSCATWRRRAEVHAAANTALLALARRARETALRMLAERNAARSRSALFQMQAEIVAKERQADSQRRLSPTPDADDQSELAPPVKRRRLGLPSDCDEMAILFASG